MNPLISIIVPVYRIGAYLERCVDSLLSQTYENLEILLVDDGSPDECPALCDRLAQKDGRITVIHKENGGVASARNAGLAAARGGYIGFVDGDDYIEPGMYAALMDAVERHQTGMAVCGFAMEPEEAPAVLEPKSGDVTVMDHLDYLRGILRGEVVTVCWNKLMTRELARQAFPPIAIGEDAVYLTDVLLQPCRVAVVRGDYYHYVQRGGSARISAFSPKHLESLRCAAMVAERVRARCPQFAAELAAFEYEYFIGTLARIHVWDVEAQYADVIAALERDIRRVFPTMDRTAVSKAKVLAWHCYRVSRGAFKAVMKWYYGRTLYKNLK